MSLAQESCCVSGALDPIGRVFNGDARYCVWRTDYVGHKPRKTPYRSLTARGASNNPSTWLTRVAAERLAQDPNGNFEGLGVYLGDNPDGSILAGVDLDTCRDLINKSRADWADDVIKRLRTYTEVSPSKTGYKAYFIIAAEERDRVLRLLDRGNGERGAQWKRNADGEHPPAIELYTAWRFFALTFDGTQDAPEELATVPFETLRWLIEEYGPAFAGRRAPLLSPSSRNSALHLTAGDLYARGQEALKRLEERGHSWPKLAALLCGDTSHLGNDKSRSARDFALVGFCKDVGLSEEDARAALYAYPHGAGREHHDGGDRRYFSRIWAKVRNDDCSQRGDGAFPESCLSGDQSERGAELLSEDSAALMFTERYADELLFDHDASTWLRWCGTHWKRDRTNVAFHFARELARDLARDKSAKVRVTGGKTTFAGGVERFSRAAPEFARTSDDWDRDRYLLGTPAGTVDLRTGELRSADPADCISRITGAAPSDDADCPTWLRFLEDATGRDDGLMNFLRCWIGYCLTGDTREQALVFVYGSGGNGKSVFLRTVSDILGDYVVTAPMDAFEASSSSKHPTDLAMLRGARLVTASETEEGHAWAEARIKAITGGDPITARFMRQDFFTYTPQFKLTIVGNHMPVLTNVDDAARRRFNIVPFVRKPPEPDPNLQEKLRAEYPAILRWMIHGCLDWQQRGLVRPPVVENATAEYFSDQDLFQQWLDECCDVAIGNAAKSEPAASLYTSWRAFAENAGERCGSKKSFGQQMLRRGFRRERTATQRRFRGVSLRVEPTYRGEGA